MIEEKPVRKRVKKIAPLKKEELSKKAIGLKTGSRSDKSVAERKRIKRKAERHRVFPDVDPQTPLNKHEIEMIKIYCHSPQEPDSKYIAFMKAGYLGTKDDCDALFATVRIKKGIQRYNQKEHIILPNKYRLLTEKLTQKLEQALIKGMTNGDACKVVGLLEPVFYRWVKEGKAAYELDDFDNPLSKFYFRATRARAIGEDNLLECIYASALGKGIAEEKVETIENNGVPIRKIVNIRKRQWQAAAWLLEKTRRNKYGKEEKTVETVDPQVESENIASALKMLTETQIEEEEKLKQDLSNEE